MKRLKTFAQFISAIENFKRKSGSRELWFRGHGSEVYKLEPFTHRSKTAADKADIASNERAVFAEFNRRYPLYDQSRRDPWDLLFLMQHYRAPTRLLDWTSSPLIALYFSLMDADDVNDAVVWGLDPAEWNRIVLQDISEPSRIFTTEERLVEQYHPYADAVVSRTEPLAIHGIVNNPRLNAQKGKFVIFSSEPKSLEDYSKSFKIKNDGGVLHRISIDRDSKKNLLKEVESYGITYSTIFPDLEGLAVEIRRQYGA